MFNYYYIIIFWSLIRLTSQLRLAYNNAHAPSGLWWRAGGRSWWCWRAHPARAEPCLHTDTEPDHPSCCRCRRNAGPEGHTPSGSSAQTSQEHQEHHKAGKSSCFQCKLYLDEPWELLLDVLQRWGDFLLRVSQSLQKLFGFGLNRVQIYTERTIQSWLRNDWSDSWSRDMRTHTHTHTHAQPETHTHTNEHYTQTTTHTHTETDTHSHKQPPTHTETDTHSHTHTQTTTHTHTETDTHTYDLLFYPAAFSQASMSSGSSSSSWWFNSASWKSQDPQTQHWSQRAAGRALLRKQSLTI